MTIKLELPDNNAVVLRNFGLALNNIAAELEPETLGGGRPKDRTKVIQEAFEETLGGGRPKDRTKVVQIEGVISEDCEIEPVITGEQTDESTKLENGVEVDSKGLPHDTRIHGDNRAKTANGEWKNRRHPSSKFATKEEWQQFITDVENELRAAMSAPAVEVPVVEIPVEQNIDIDVAIEDFVNAEVPAVEAPVVPAPPAVEAPVVPAPPAVEAPVVPAPPVAEAPVVPAPPVVEAPVVPAPPVVEAPVVPVEGYPVKTFVELMTRITSAGPQAVPTIQSILTEMGVGSLPTLNTAAPEKIGEAYARFEKAIQGV